ncbi:MAG: ACP S-malonyltransferase [Chloroflexi bacterium]|nr:ACP S-malonyltransferase [Chloroflexota bacterium]
MGQVAWLFPGQGSQYVGMGEDLADVYPQARDVFQRADEILGFPLSQLMFHGPEETLTDTVNAQPAIFTHSAAVLAVVRALRPEWEPDFLAGHSLGEYSALYAAGVFSFEDALQLVRERGRLMKLAGEQQPGGMAALLGLDMDTVRRICAQAEEETGLPVRVANDNCPGQVVISGAIPALERAMELAREAKARKVVRLAVSIAAHSPLMGVVSDTFAEKVRSTPMRPPERPVVMNAIARPATSVEEIRDVLIAQLTSPVRWTESVQYMLGEGVDTFYELGPKDVLVGLVKRIQRKSTRIALGTVEALRQHLAPS